jgi:uncharacterized DUF497 family protein
MSDDELYSYLGRIFEWNRLKATRNVLKHDVRFTEAASIFFDENALFEPDPEHSDDEDRYIILGYSIKTNVLIVAHVYRGEHTRIISARKATPSERSTYEARLGR